ncbi:MAG: gluconate 2-dehydrogenase subunit 3 family protein [Gemmatimonadaceae bacterium]
MSDDREMHDNVSDDSAATPVTSDAHGSEARMMKRRDALKAIATTAVAVPLTGALTARSVEGRTLPVVESTALPDESINPLPPMAGPRGTKWDPDLLHPKVTWSMKLTASELATLTVLCDLIIPADAKSPAASAVGVPAYINEYVSAPGDWYERALVQVRGGLAWIDVESNKRFGKRFATATNAQRTQICDDICYQPKAKAEFLAASKFFDRVRDLTAEAFYTTDAGMKDIGYVGNYAMLKFDSPPPEVLKHLGLA